MCGEDGMNYFDIVNEDDQRNVLRSGLLGPLGKHSFRYSNSPMFRQHVDTVVALLPSFIAFLEKEAFENDKRVELEAMRQQLMAREAHRFTPPEFYFEIPSDLRQGNPPHG